MFWQALLAVIVMPGMVAYAIPLLWLWGDDVVRLAHPSALAATITGTAGLLWCVWDFFVRGRGTLAPWSPPRKLVVGGLYRYSRNPMYVCVVLVLLGWAAGFAFWGLLGYATVIAAMFHLRVVYGEEPWLAQRYGSEWSAYTRRVARWLPIGRSRAAAPRA